MEQNDSLEANWCSANHEIPQFYTTEDSLSHSYAAPIDTQPEQQCIQSAPSHKNPLPY